MSTIVAPTVETPTVNLVPSRKSRKNGNGNPPITENPAKAALVAKLTTACQNYAASCSGMGLAAKAMGVSRGALKSVTAELAGSGLFTASELVGLVQSACEKAGMTPQSASNALVAAGIRQRAKRSDAGKDRGPKNPSAETPAASAPALPKTPAELAKALVAKLGKEAAIQFCKAAYTEAALG